MDVKHGKPTMEIRNRVRIFINLSPRFFAKKKNLKFCMLKKANFAVIAEAVVVLVVVVLCIAEMSI